MMLLAISVCYWKFSRFSKNFSFKLFMKIFRPDILWQHFNFSFEFTEIVFESWSDVKFVELKKKPEDVRELRNETDDILIDEVIIEGSLSCLECRRQLECNSLASLVTFDVASLWSCKWGISWTFLNKLIVFCDTGICIIVSNGLTMQTPCQFAWN